MLQTGQLKPTPAPVKAPDFGVSATTQTGKGPLGWFKRKRNNFKANKQAQKEAAEKPVPEEKNYTSWPPKKPPPYQTHY
jgi:hypothetical protein